MAFPFDLRMLLAECHFMDTCHQCSYKSKKYFKVYKIVLTFCSKLFISTGKDFQQIAHFQIY